jgi:signal transduction histidine kinase
VAARPPVRYALALAFAAIAVVFTLGLAASHTFVARIRTAAAEITDNSSLSISSMSGMRGALRRLQVAVAEVVDTCDPRGCPSADRVTALQDELRTAWNRYRLLPTFPGETDLWGAVDEGLDRTGREIATTLDSARADRRAEAAGRLRDRVTPAFDRLDAALGRIQESDYAEGDAAATRIAELARLATGASVAVAVLTIALTVLAAWLAIGLVQRYERSLRDRADDLELFAGRVAHDLRGPLTSMAAALQQAQRLSSGPTREAVNRGQRGLDRVRELVEDLLDFARAGALGAHGAATDVTEVVDDVVGYLKELAAENRVEVRVEDRPHEHVACSRGVLTSIVQNLLQNAITHMRASEIRVVRVRVPPAAGARRIRIEVEDTGPGIPEPLGDAVFEPFVRGAAPGALGHGIGLATVKRFVNAHGGRVGFRPTSGRGTVFWLEMPRGVASASRAVPRV